MDLSPSLLSLVCLVSVPCVPSASSVVSLPSCQSVLSVASVPSPLSLLSLSSLLFAHSASVLSVPRPACLAPSCVFQFLQQLLRLPLLSNSSRLQLAG